MAILRISQTNHLSNIAAKKFIEADTAAKISTFSSSRGIAEHCVAKGFGDRDFTQPQGSLVVSDAIVALHESEKVDKQKVLEFLGQKEVFVDDSNGTQQKAAQDDEPQQLNTTHSTPELIKPQHNLMQHQTS